MKLVLSRSLAVGASVLLAVIMTIAPGTPAANAAAKKTAFPAFIPFDAAQGEIPEGVAVDKVGNVYVSIGGPSGPRGEIWKFTPAGQKSVLVVFGTPGAVGLAVDAIGNVYVARPGFGVFRVDQRGRAVRLPGTEQIVFANSLAFDPRGTLYVTESFSFDPPLIDYPGCNAGTPQFGRGGVWRIARGGTAELWLRHDLLTGLCPVPFAIPFPVGANGLGYYHGDLYVANTDKCLVVRIPVRPDGAPGLPEVLASGLDPDPAMLPLFGPPMVDGLTLDVHGNIYLPVINRHAVVRLSADGQSWQTIATAADQLDFPASLAFGTGKGQRTCIFASNLAAMPGGAGPGLVKIDAGVPGLPLP